VARRYGDRLPTDRPGGLRLSVLRHRWYRLDTAPPEDWDWSPYPLPRSRFDSAGGTERVRYAAQTRLGALRERFAEQGRVVSRDELRLHLVEVTGVLRVLDLRHERNLDVLGLDDQISTGRSPDVWSAAQRLSDLVHDWYGERCHGIAYRSRTTPQTSGNLAWWASAPVTLTDLGRLREQDDLLVTAILAQGFTVEGW
jgi:hypothetical protein